MSLPRRQVVELGERLRDAPTPSPEDLELLAEVLLEYNAALDAVATGLRSIGEVPTTRLKTSGTIIEKLRRERHLNLRIIRDLAGARIVKRMSLDEQDALASRIMDLWPEAKLIDRRERPSHGYRAIHIVPVIDRCPVEIQLRTLYQDTWAQTMESLGDAWGRDIRYGGEPEDPDHLEFNDPPRTRSELVQLWKVMAEPLHHVAQMENEIARLKARLGPEKYGDELSKSEAALRSIFPPVQTIATLLREVLDRRSDG